MAFTIVCLLIINNDCNIQKIIKYDLIIQISILHNYFWITEIENGHIVAIYKWNIVTQIKAARFRNRRRSIVYPRISKSEDAGMDHKMTFLVGHYLSVDIWRRYADSTD
jgi:hypothetical protein